MAILNHVRIWNGMEGDGWELRQRKLRRNFETYPHQQAVRFSCVNYLFSLLALENRTMSD